MNKKYHLEKWVWTEKDFDNMGWHDSIIHSLAFFPEDFEFALDIDYIFQWIDPEEGEKHFHFWVAPANLVFENVYDLRFDIETDSKIEIDAITRENPQKPNNSEHIEKQTEWRWNIECQEGTISFKSVGYKMFVKQEPVFTCEQSLSLENRGSISFVREKT